ncbi:putative GTP-binding protein EngB [Clostridia bacterium]|nr:putative GTP-binding protein EngB [Clostridia bacterium]
MFIQEVELETVCGITSKLPTHEHLEFAFCGKSNVGKSSLLNSLVNRKSLARTSAAPGKTQTINFYHIHPNLHKKDPEIYPNFYFVDLPGYGYAKVPLKVKKEWGKMTERYLKQSKTLAAIFLLLDIRHIPSENDRQMYQWIQDSGHSLAIIATKSDKIKPSQLDKQVKQIRNHFQLDPKIKIFPFSSLKKTGKEEVLSWINEVCMQRNSI